MSHIHHQVSAHFVCHLTETLKINGPGISAGSGHDQLRLCLKRDPLQLVIIDIALVIDAVRHYIEVKAGKIHRASVGQMAAVVQIHAHNRITRFQHGYKNRHIGLGAGVRLHIGIVTAKQLLSPFYGKSLHYVHALTSAVVPLSRIPFRVLVGQHRTHGHHNRLGNDILRRDQLQVPSLAGRLRLNGLAYFRIKFGNKLHNFINHH